MKKVVLFLSLITVIGFSGCGAPASSDNVNSQENGVAGDPGLPADGQTPEALRMQLLVTEQMEPLKYLTADGSTMTHNLVREAGLLREAEYDGWMVEGTISNSATLARFKDVVITISMISQTGSVIEEADYTIFEFFEPNSTKSFSIKTNPSEATEKFRVTVKGATAVD